VPTSEECLECPDIGDRCGDGFQRLTLPSDSRPVFDPDEQSFLRGRAAAGRYITFVGHWVEGGREGVRKSVGVGGCVDRRPYLYHNPHTSCLLERESTGTHNHKDVRF